MERLIITKLSFHIVLPISVSITFFIIQQIMEVIKPIFAY